MSISVIIPVYNTAPWLAECIDSVLSVSGSPPLEIILVDDESTDCSRDIMQSYAARYSNITALFQTHGRQGKARNSGLAHATGKYILFLDSDDRLYKNSLTRFYDQAEQQHVDFIVGLARSFRGRKKWINEGYTVYDTAVACTNLDAFPQLLADPSACNKLYRRAFLKQHDIFFPENTYCEDVGFVYKASLLAERVAVLPEILHEYRGRESGTSPSGTQTFSPDRVIQCARIYRLCLEEYHEKKPTLIAMLEDRAIIRFMRFFNRMEFYPDADALLYREMQLLLQQINPHSIAEHGNALALPFLMIREGCFRHAVAVLNNRNNTVAQHDFFELIRSEGKPDFASLRLFTAKKQPGSIRLSGILKSATIRMALGKALRFWAARKQKKRIGIRHLSIVLLWNIILAVSRPFIRAIVRKRTWLIGERGGMGIEENGYVFFKYCISMGKRANVYYLLNKEVPLPPDFPDASLLVRKYTWRHFYLLCLADVFVFTNTVDDVCPSGILRNITLRTVQTVFLTHGVNLYGPGVYMRNNTEKIDKIIVVSEEEKKQKIKDWVVNDPKKMIITGLPRFDKLLGHAPDREILFYLTWRKRLDNLSPQAFRESLYCNAILSFLKHPRLVDFLVSKNMRLRFRFHFRMQDHADEFANYASEHVLVEYSDRAVPLRKVLQKAGVLITDYSSIMWDMAYMQRPVLLYQFDVDGFLAERNLHGFSTKEASMEFTTVVRNQEELLCALHDLSRKNFVLNEAQKHNALSFFQFHDTKNCERVFQMIEQGQGSGFKKQAPFREINQFS